MHTMTPVFLPSAHAVRSMTADLSFFYIASHNFCMHGILWIFGHLDRFG